MDCISKNELDGPVKDSLLKVANRFIRTLRSVFHIHCFFGGNHRKKGYHPLGLALDGHKGKFIRERKQTDLDIDLIAANLCKLVDKKEKSLFEQAILARLSGFTGVGMYPHWYPKPGMHLDIRPLPLGWIGLNKKKTLDLIIKEKELQKLVDESDLDKLQDLFDKIEGEQFYIYLK